MRACQLGPWALNQSTRSASRRIVSRSWGRLARTGRAWSSLPGSGSNVSGSLRIAAAISSVGQGVEPRPVRQALIKSRSRRSLVSLPLIVPRSRCADQPYPVAAPREDDRDDAPARHAIGEVAALSGMVLGQSNLEHILLPDLLGVNEIDPVLGQVGSRLASTHSKSCRLGAILLIWSARPRSGRPRAEPAGTPRRARRLRLLSAWMSEAADSARELDRRLP